MTFCIWKSCVHAPHCNTYDNKWIYKSLKSIVSLCLVMILSACTHTTTQTQNSVLVNPEIGIAFTSIHEQDAEYWYSVFNENKSDTNAAINLSRILRLIGRDLQALLVMQEAIAIHPNDPDVLIELGKVFIQNGRVKNAMKVIQRIRRMGIQDWQLLSAYGTALDKKGQHIKARNYYEEALLLAPDMPIILNNLGMSYALDKNLEQAEIILRQAVSQPHASDQVYENLALVLGLQGKFEESEEVARFVLPGGTAKNNTMYLKSMVDQPDNWSKLKLLKEDK